MHGYIWQCIALYVIEYYVIRSVINAVDGVAIGGVVLNGWYHVPRLLFQPVIIWWALWAGTVVDWPFRTASVRQP